MADITITEGDTLEVDYSVENTGDSAGNQDIDLVIEGVLEDTDANIVLNPGQTATGTLQWPTQSGDAVTNALAEAVTDNTSDSITVDVEADLPGAITIPDSGDRASFSVDGFGSDFEIVSSPDAIAGSLVWESTDTNMTNSRNSSLVSFSGLNNYPSQGDEFRFYVKEIPSSNDNTGIATVFGVQSGSLNGDGTGDYYGIHLLKGSPVALTKNGNINTGEDIATGSANVSDGQWYEIHVDWGTTISVTVYEVDNSGNRTSTFDSLSANDSSYSSGGIGWTLANSTGGGIRFNDWRTI